MRFTTRTFLFTFIPFALLLMGAFWAIQRQVVSSVRGELRNSLVQTQVSFAGLSAQSDLQNQRFLRLVGENAMLKAGLQLTLAEPDSPEARQTLAEQLREIAATMRFDLLMASTASGKPLAGVVRTGDQITGMDLTGTQASLKGFHTVGDTTYQVASVDVNQGDEALGTLSIGDKFDFTQFATPAVLTRDGKVVQSNLKGVATGQLESSLASCSNEAECQITMNGESYISLPMSNLNFGNGYLLRSLQNVDAASGNVQTILRNVFLVSGLAALMGAFVIAMYSSRSVVRPLGEVVAQLRKSAQTGDLPEFPVRRVPVLEIQQLTESFNHAAEVIRESKDSLRDAYFEFIGAMASALDARDRYTAGHSTRVSERAVAIANSMNLEASQVEDIRIGSLLHDIGKIGVSDTVLLKASRLTDAEFKLIQQHPVIGRRILEGVSGFKAYLPIVELHHENWDGTGYPLGLAGEAVPLSARIVHVVDAYDAMTSDRPYRKGMSHEEAVAILHHFAGSQFDPNVVAVFESLTVEAQLRPGAEVQRFDAAQLASLAGALSKEAQSLIRSVV